MQNVVQYLCRTPHRILDNEGREVAYLAGKPSSKTNQGRSDYDEDVRRVAQLFRTIRAAFPKECEPACGQRGRGDFACMNFGVYMGGGGMKPHSLAPPNDLKVLVPQIRENPSLRRIAHFQSGELKPSFLPIICTN